MSKPNALANLMVKLSVDPALRRQFQEDPSALKDEAGLSDEELSLLAGGNPGQIRAYLGGDAPSECFVMFLGDDKPAR
jgi:hypothetical protein